MALVQISTNSVRLLADHLYVRIIFAIFDLHATSQDRGRLGSCIKNPTTAENYAVVTPDSGSIRQDFAGFWGDFDV